MIVADTNLVSYLLIEGDRTEAARQVWARDPNWRLPPLWRSEFLNVLATSVRAGVLSLDQARTAWTIATAMLGESEEEPTGDHVLQLAIRLGISAYDAQFVAVAEACDLLLVTGDRRLLEACGDRAVSIEVFGSH